MKRSISCIALALALATAPMVSAPALAGAEIDFAIYRGPAGTDIGYLLFVRTVNGPLDHIFDTKKLPFSWNPSFAPRIMEHLKPYARSYV